MYKTGRLIFVLGLLLSVAALADNPVNRLDSSQSSIQSSHCQIQCDYGGFVSCTDQSPYQYCESGSDYVFCYSTGYVTCAECYPRIYCDQ